jgi:hypothetical protein
MDAATPQESRFRAAYFLLSGYTDFFEGYVVADVLKAPMPAKLVTAACGTLVVLILYAALPMLWPRVRVTRNKPFLITQWIGISAQ